MLGPIISQSRMKCGKKNLRYQVKKNADIFSTSIGKKIPHVTKVDEGNSRGLAGKMFEKPVSGMAFSNKLASMQNWFIG